MVDSYYDKNPSPYLYEPDLTQPGRDNGKIPNQSIRVTWQASRKDKIQGWFTNQNKYRSHYNISASRTPDATSLQNTPVRAGDDAEMDAHPDEPAPLRGRRCTRADLYQELYQPT